MAHPGRPRPGRRPVHRRGPARPRTDLVNAHAEQLNLGYRRTDRTDLVSVLARLAGLLDLTPTDDTRLLAARLRATPPGTDCMLSDAEEAAHARTADRMNHMWAHGSGIDRYLS